MAAQKTVPRKEAAAYEVMVKNRIDSGIQSGVLSGRFGTDIKEKGFWILVVDDGSSEEHKIIFRDINDVGNVLILTHIKMKERKCFKTGLSYIQTNISDYCIVVTVDADGQHSPSDVEKICKEAQRYPGYLILGSRKIQKETPFKK